MRPARAPPPTTARRASPLHCSGGETADELALEQDQDDEDRQGGDHGAGGDEVELVDVARLQPLEAYLDRAVIVIGDDRRRPQVLVPCAEKREQREGAERRP